jgi:aryl-alcohol dehydrogenase-like predicted oxidoreductase
MVSEVCLGTMTFSREADKQTSFAIMDAYAERGGFFIDTANMYAGGASEETVGAWIADRKNRAQIILATKVFNAVGPGPNQSGLSRLHMVTEVENSLRRLKTEVIDIYQIHRWHVPTPIEETARALDDLVRAGKVRYVGCSNLRAYQLLLFLHHQRDSLLERFVSIQPAYNAVNRAIELEILPLAEREGLGVVTYNPLAGGLLTGKYNTGAAAEDSRLRTHEYYTKRYYTDTALGIAERFVSHADSTGFSPAQLALAWVKSDPRITAPIVGARSVPQLTDTLGALDRPLSAEERLLVPAIESGRWVGEDPVYDRTAYK